MSSSSERDDSSDEEWVPDEEMATDDGDRDEASESSCDENDAVPLVDMAGDQENRVAKLIDGDPCTAKCLAGKDSLLSSFVCSLDRMTKPERLVSAMTSLGMLMQMETVERRRGTGERSKFPFYLPLVGKVCQQVFCAAYRISPRSLARYKKRIGDGGLSPNDHGSVGNAYRQSVDVDWLVRWFRDFADKVGDRIAVRERTKEVRDGRLVRYTTENIYTLIPAMFTWARLHEEMKLEVEQTGIRRFEPAEATFRKLLSAKCPDIRIRSPRSNVCDICVIYHGSIARDQAADKVEEQAKHAENARAMRLEYAADAAKASDSAVVPTMDYSQNLTLPNLANTPSNFYFMSLINVSLFGIHCAGTQKHHHFVYNFCVTSRGPPTKSLTVYADNCGGQNKNNFVIKYFLLLAHIGFFEEIQFKFFVKGHTKNACDRGFGHIKKRFVKSDCWTMDDIESVVSEASVSSIVYNLDGEPDPFFDYKPIVNELYKNVKGLQKYQIFRMSSEFPGRLECLESPRSPPVIFYLARSYDGRLVDEDRALDLLDQVKSLPRPELNPEKVHDLHKNVTPYLPEQYRNLPFYAAPTETQTEAARAKKKARTTAKPVEK